MNYDDRYTDSILLFYDKKTNLFFDEGGYAIFSIFGIITPNQLYLFKQKKQYMTVHGVHGDLVELVWPEEDTTYCERG